VHDDLRGLNSPLTLTDISGEAPSLVRKGCRDCGAHFLLETSAQRRCRPCCGVLAADQLGRRPLVTNSRDVIRACETGFGDRRERREGPNHVISPHGCADVVHGVAPALLEAMVSAAAEAYRSRPSAVAGQESVNERTCAHCTGSLDGMRSHARYCSTSCRVLAHRGRASRDRGPVANRDLGPQLSTGAASFPFRSFPASEKVGAEEKGAGAFVGGASSCR
jgi:hypothetical protein